VTVGALAQWRTAGIGSKYFKAGGIKYELRDMGKNVNIQFPPKS
jgi:hypothetical protein